MVPNVGASSPKANSTGIKFTPYISVILILKSTESWIKNIPTDPWCESSLDAICHQWLWMVSFGQILWKFLLKKTWYLHELGTWAYAWIMWIIWNWLLISVGLSTCLHVNLLGIHSMSMFSNWWQWTIEVCSYWFYTIINMLSFTKFMPRVHYYVPLHMCTLVCQKVNSDGWLPRTIFDEKIFNSQREGDFCTLTK